MSNSDNCHYRHIPLFEVLTVTATILVAIATWYGVYVTSKYNRETVAIAENTFQENKKTHEDQRGQFAKLQQDAAADREVQQNRFDKEQSYEAKKQEEERGEAARLERLARLPLLVQYQCCNPVAAIFTRLSDGGRKIRLPKREEYEYFGPDFNKDHVIRITNLGQGPALRVYASWHAERLRFKSGKEKQLETGRYVSNYSKPMHVKPNDVALIVHLPGYCYQPDDIYGEQRLAHVEGYLELMCVDNADEKHTFEYVFTMDVDTELRTIRGGVTAGAIYIHVSDSPKDQPSVPPNTPLQREPTTKHTDSNSLTGSNFNNSIERSLLVPAVYN